MKQGILFLLLLTGSSLNISAQEKMIIHMKDGQTISYEMSKVDFVELQAPEGDISLRDTIAGIGGIVSGSIDLGTSVKWAIHNVGSLSLSNTGGRYTWDDACAAITSWGEGWRLPTEADWQELYEKCTWEWITIDGIGGRLVKGDNGNTVFFPATGLAIEDKLHVIGSLGVYWTASSSGEDSKNALGAYFDSANIYRMEFPKSNTFSLRLVRDKEQ